MTHEKTTLTSSGNLLFPQQQNKKWFQKFWQALLDSGASAHMFGHLRFFLKGSLKPCYKKIECADGKFLYAYWQGTVLLIRDPKLPKDHESNVLVCNNALLVEGISKHLVSVSVLTTDGYSIEFVDNNAIVRGKPDKKKRRNKIYVLEKAIESDKLYHFPFITCNDTVSTNNMISISSNISAAMAGIAQVDKNILHARYNHCHEHYIDILNPKVAKQELSFCYACALAGLKSKPYKQKTTYPKIEPSKPPPPPPPPKSEMALTTSDKITSAISIPTLGSIQAEVQPRMKVLASDKPFSKIAMDAKTSPIVSVRGFKYAFVIICMKTRFTYAILTKTKDLIAQEYTTWSKELFNRTGVYPAMIRLDLAGEHRSTVLMTLFKECGTKVTFSATDEHNENSFVERKIGVLWLQTKIVSTHAYLPFVFWCFAFAYVTCVSNHVPHRGLGGKRPVEVAGMTAVDNLLRILGCESVFYKPTGFDNELTGHLGIFLGFAEHIRGYWFLDLDTRKVEASRTAIFRENSLPFVKAATSMGLPVYLKNVKWPEKSKEGGPPITIQNYPSTSPTINNDEKIIPSTLFLPTDKHKITSPLTKPFTTVPPIDFEEHPPQYQETIIPKASKKRKQKFSASGVKQNDFQKNYPLIQNKHLKANNFHPVSSIRGTKPNTAKIPFPLTTREIQNKDNKSSTDLPKQGYQVDEIIGHRRQRFGKRNSEEEKGYDFKVKWSDKSTPTFEPRSNLNGCRTTLRRYTDLHNIDPGPMTPTKSLKSELEEVILPLHHQREIDNLIDHNRLHSINNPIENIFTSEPLSKPAPDLPNIQEEPNHSELANSAKTKRKSIPIFLNKEGEVLAYDGQQLHRKKQKTTNPNTGPDGKIDPPPNLTEHIFHTGPDPDLNEVLQFALNVMTEITNNDGSIEEPPKNEQEMLNGNRTEEFIGGEIKELEAIGLHGTAIVVIRPKDRTPITCRWVYDFKRNDKNEITIFKARLVVHGFKQLEGIDYNKTFSSTAHMRSFRMIVMLACAFDLEVTQYDISNAFLNGILNEEIYMEFPPGYPGIDPNTCLQLLKGLYGLKQASRIWSDCLMKELKKTGLVPCKTDPGILWHPKYRCFVCIHVDDIIVATSEPGLREKILKIMTDAFLVKDLGKLHKFVGIKVTKTANTITLDQAAYLERVLKKFKFWLNTQEGKNPNFPEKLSKLDLPFSNEEWNELKDFPYPNIVGSLMYAATASRPDLLPSVIALSRYMSFWGDKHIKAVKHTMKYVRSTYKDNIKFTRPSNFKGILDIIAFSDSDWAGCPDTRRSTVGFIIFMCGGPIAWKSKKKETLALSSCEAEYMGLSEVGRELIWITHFLTEIGVEFNRPRIYCDSDSAIDWAEEPIQHQRNKHVELTYYYIRDIVKAELIDLYRVSTHDNHSDPFSKNLITPTFLRHKPNIMGWTPVILSEINQPGSTNHKPEKRSKLMNNKELPPTDKHRNTTYILPDGAAPNEQTKEMETLATIKKIPNQFPEIKTTKKDETTC
jgi:hypothetical protein